MTKDLKITLNSIDRVKAFVNCNSKFLGDIDVISGRYVIDGKSIMGIFSLDLTKELLVRFHCDDEATFNNLIDSYKKAELI